ncbi:hypothetical protein V1279_000107 [Bradyrhizobium sp. AZCC 1610]|uniref:hypothetical protein n=1 Tax=Bradyrhizobium sp. AZCC 1610 TaxID=3117020 RepID=UPI002FF2D341
MNKPRQPSEDFLAAIGRLTISWAEIEFGIDLILFVAYHELGGNEIEKEKPWAMERKIKLLRKCFSNLPGLASAREVGLAILDEVKSTSETRQDIIHGITIEQFDASDKTTMIRLLRGSTPNAHKRFSIDTTQILTSAVAASKLAGRAMALGNLLLEVRSEPLNQTSSELPG